MSREPGWTPTTSYVREAYVATVQGADGSSWLEAQAEFSRWLSALLADEGRRQGED